LSLFINKHIQAQENVYVINNSSEKIFSSYQDKFDSYTTLEVAPKKSIPIKVENYLFVRYYNEKIQDELILLREDSIEIFSDKEREFTFRALGKNKIIRSNELSLMNYVNKNVTLSEHEVLVSKKKFSRNYTKLDSIFEQDYAEKIKLVDSYKNEYPISAKYEGAVKHYYEALKIVRKLIMVMDVTVKTNDSYLHQLALYKENIYNICKDEIPLNIIFGKLFYYFQKYNYRNVGNEAARLDSIYRISANEAPSKIKDELLFLIVKDALFPMVKKGFSRTDDFFKDCTDPEFISYINDVVTQNKISNDIKIKSDLLTSIQNKTILYNEVIKAEKGKIVLIDVWASWCAPCREEMPKAAEIRKLYNQKDIVFMYLSIDENMAPGKKQTQKKD
jgi:thiol-disulfide isomerase/thioredoxin